MTKTFLWHEEVFTRGAVGSARVAGCAQFEKWRREQACRVAAGVMASPTLDKAVCAIDAGPDDDLPGFVDAIVASKALAIVDAIIAAPDFVPPVPEREP